MIYTVWSENISSVFFLHVYFLGINKSTYSNRVRLSVLSNFCYFEFYKFLVFEFEKKNINMAKGEGNFFHVPFLQGFPDFFRCILFFYIQLFSFIGKNTIRFIYIRKCLHVHLYKILLLPILKFIKSNSF